MKPQDWTALLGLKPYSEEKGFEYDKNIQIVLGEIASAYSVLDIRTDPIFLTSETFPEILMDENVIRFFLHLHRINAIQELHLPMKVTLGPGSWYSVTHAPIQTTDYAFLQAIKNPKEFKKSFVSLRITDRKAFFDAYNTAAEALGIKAKPKTPVVMDNKLAFDSETSVLSFMGKETMIPINTNQFYLCKKMFGTPIATRVKEQEIMDMIDWNKDANRGVYDAMRHINKRAKSDLGIPQLFHWRLGVMWRDQ